MKNDYERYQSQISEYIQDILLDLDDLDELEGIEAILDCMMSLTVHMIELRDAYQINRY